MNKVIIIGRLGQDPKMINGLNGKTSCSMSVATTEKFTSNGEKKEKTEWHNVMVFGNSAEHCLRYLEKGRMVAVEGKLNTYKKTSDKGDQYITQIVAENIQFLGGVNNNNGSNLPDNKQGNSYKQSQQDSQEFDDIPF